MISIIFICACILMVAAMIACSHIFIDMCNDLHTNWKFGKVIKANIWFYLVNIIPFIVGTISYLALIAFGTAGIVEIVKMIGGV